MSNLTEHKCAGKCPEFKGEQCDHCLINETPIQGVYLIHRTEHRIDHIVGFNNMGDDPLYTITCTHCSRLFEDDSDLDNTLYDAELDEYHDGCPDCKTDSWMMDITPVSKSNLISRKQFLLKNGLPYFTYKELLEIGDDTHIENHISPLCLSDSRKNESQSPLSIKQDALSRMESCYIEQKKHVELLQTEVTRLNSTVERLKAENVAMQVELDKSRNQAYKHLESCENSLNSQTERFDELSEKVFKVFEIINNPDNHYCPFGWVAEQIQAVLGEVQGEVS